MNDTPDRLELHAEAFRAAILELHAFTHDDDTAPGKLSGQIAAGREAVGIAARRLSAAHAAQVEAQAGAAEGAAVKLEAKALELRDAAEKQGRIAEGTLRGLYGDDVLVAIVNRGIPLRSLKAAELLAQADALASQAEELRTAAVSSRAAAMCGPVRPGDRVTLARIRELTPMQLAGDCDNLVNAALHGRIVEG